MIGEMVSHDIGSRDLLIRDDTNLQFLYHGVCVLNGPDVSCARCFMEDDATDFWEKETVPDLIMPYDFERVSMDILCDSVRQLCD